MEKYFEVLVTMQGLIDLTTIFKFCPNSREEKKQNTKKAFEGLLSLVFWKRVALSDDAQLEVRMLVLYL